MYDNTSQWEDTTEQSVFQILSPRENLKSGACLQCNLFFKGDRFMFVCEEAVLHSLSDLKVLTGVS